MEVGNWTMATDFILLGLTDDPMLQVPLFMFFLMVYAVTLLFNIGIMTLISLSHHLHTPMYFLLCSLSFVDICLSTVTVPKLLIILSDSKTISFSGCVAQLFSSFVIGGSEVFLLAVMAYDRYTAICNPLLYSVIMSKRTCIFFLVWIFVIATLNGLINTSLTFILPLCKSNEITHFYCDVPPILKLSCSDTTLNEVVLVSTAGGLIVISLICILISYTYIVSAILKISSSEGRQKTFSTCSSHFVCVIFFFGTLVFMYVKPTSSHSMARDRVASVFYMVLIPMLNPMIYSLRNQEMKQGLRKCIGKTCIST